MANAKRDENQVTTLLAISSVDGVTVVPLWADPVTHRLLVDLPTGAGDVTGPASATDNAVVRFDGTGGKTIQNSIIIIDDSGNLGPATNDTGALGTASLSWADLFLASGAVINFANGNAAITHSSGIITVSTGDLRVTTAGTNAASVVTVGGTQTLTNKTLTAPVIATISNTGTITLPTATTTLVGRDTTDTLTNKTLTAPRIASAGFIADANGNEQIIFTTTASAVNEVTIANAATGNAPTITASGGDSNVSVRFIPKGTGSFFGNQETMIIAISDETTAITTGTAKVTFHMPYAFSLMKVKAGLSTASSSGNPAFDLNDDGVSVFSTTLTIDANETFSDDAATPSVLTSTPLAIAAKSVMTIDIDTAGTGAKGAKLYLIGYATAAA